MLETRRDEIVSNFLPQQRRTSIENISSIPKKQAVYARSDYDGRRNAGRMRITQKIY